MRPARSAVWAPSVCGAVLRPTRMSPNWARRAGMLPCRSNVQAMGIFGPTRERTSPTRTVSAGPIPSAYIAPWSRRNTASTGSAARSESRTRFIASRQGFSSMVPPPLGWAWTPGTMVRPASLPDGKRVAADLRKTERRRLDRVERVGLVGEPGDEDPPPVARVQRPGTDNETCRQGLLEKLPAIAHGCLR